MCASTHSHNIFCQIWQPLLNSSYNEHSTSNSTAYYHSSNAHQFPEFSTPCRAIPSRGQEGQLPPKLYSTYLSPHYNILSYKCKSAITIRYVHIHVFKMIVIAPSKLHLGHLWPCSQATPGSGERVWYTVSNGYYNC